MSDSRLRIASAGASGRMGRMLIEAVLAAPDCLLAGALDIAALSVIAGIAPGAPLCRAWSQRPDRDGLEIVLKGGQMGAPGFFGDVLLGCPPG